MQWFLTVAAFVLAAAALARARRAAKRLERLSESYWELQYELGQLRARVARLETPEGADPSARPDVAPGRPAQGSFVPLASLKR